MIYALFSGSLGTVFFFSLFWYVSTRHRAYAFFALHILFLFITISITQVPRLSFEHDMLLLMSSSLALLSLILFLVTFLELKRDHLRLYRRGKVQLYHLFFIGALVGVIMGAVASLMLFEDQAYRSNAFMIAIVWEILFLTLALHTKVQKEHYEKTRTLSQLKVERNTLYQQSRYASLGETVGNIAHQWKQPLNAIAAIQNSIKAALLFQGAISKEKLLSSVETSFKLLRHLAETIDTFYSFLSQRSTEESRFVLSHELDTIRKITQYSFENSRIKLIFRLDVDPTIEGNANEFTHALLNLILNAKEALDDAEPKDPVITVHVTEEKTDCIITVADNAGGIPIRPIERIFDRHISSKEETPGMGMGLYMTKNIIQERFGGTIGVENRQKGACFTITLPYVQQNEVRFAIVEEDEEKSLAYIKQLTNKIIELEEVEKTLKKWADIFKHAHWGIAIHVGNSTIFELTNAAFSTLYGYTPNELRAVTEAELFAPESLDLLPKIQNEAFEKGYAVFEAIHKRKDGSTFPVSIELIVVKDEQGEILYHIVNVWDLSESKVAQERLLLKRFALDHIQDAVYLVDEQANFHYVNEATCRTLGYSREEFEQMHVGDIDPDWPRERWHEQWNILKVVGSMTMELRHKRKDGTIFPVEVSANYIRFDDKHYNMGIARDIKKRKAAEKELHLLDRALNNTNDATYISIGLDIIQVNDGACKMLGYSREELTSMTLLDIDPTATQEELGAISSSVIKGNIRFERTHRTKEGEILDVEIVATIFEYESITYTFSTVRDISEQKKAREELLLKEFALDTINEAVFLIDQDSKFHYVNKGACNALGYTKEELLSMGVTDLDPNFPLEVWKVHWENIKRLGTTLTVTKHQRKEGTVYDIEVSSNYFKYNGNEYSLAVSRNITERLLLEEQKENRIIRTITENSPDIIVRFDTQGRRTYLNPKAVELFGIDEPSLVGTTLAQMTPVVEKDVFEMHLNSVIQSGEELSFETAYITASGKKGWSHMRVVPEFDSDGDVSSVLSIGRDMTERKEMEEALLQKEREYRTLAENNPDSIYRYDRDHRRLYVNPTVCKIVGKSAQELIGGTPDDDAILVSDQSKIVNEQIDRVFATGRSADFMINLIEQNGDSNDYHMLMVPEYDTKGTVTSVLGLTRNVTEIRSLERRQSQYFAMAPGLFATVLKDADGDYSLPFVSEGIRDVYGIEPEAAIEDISAFVAIAHPDDMEMTFAIAEESARDLVAYHVEYRIDHPQKGLRWIECNGMPQRLPDGSIRWDGFYHDITERKAQAEALALKEREFSSLAANIPDNIARWDTEGRYLYINAVHEQTLGLPASDIIGKSTREVFPDGRFSVGENSIKQVLTTQMPVCVRHPILQEDGYMGWHDVNYVPERDENGQIVGVLGIGRDMTDIYRLQDAICAREKEFRTLVENLPDDIIRYDKECKAIYVTPRMDTLNRKDMALMLLGKIPSDYGDHAKLEEYQEKVACVIATGETEEIELTFPIHTGEIHTHQIRFVAERDLTGEISGALAISTNITERKHAQETLRSNRYLLHAILESSPGVVTFALDTHYRYIAFDSKHHDVIKSIFGIEITMGMNMLEAITCDADRAIAKRSFDRALRGESFTAEEEYGDERLSRDHWQIFYAPIRSEGGEIMGLTCFNIDITKRKELELLLKKERKFLSDAQHVSHTGSWYLDVKTSALSWSDETYEIFELDKDKVDDLHTTFYECVHPDDRERVNAPYLETLRTGEAYEIEHRIVMSDGRIKYVIERCEHTYDRDGTPLYSIGTVQDISERKAQEEKLNKLYELSPLGIALTDIDGRYIEFNDAFCTICGYTLDELQELDYWALTPIEYEEQEKAQLESLKKTGRYGPYEKVYRRKNGDLIPIQLNGVLIKDFNGDDYIWSIVEDISERKQMEDALSKREQEFRTLTEKSPDTIARYDKEGVILFANAALAEITGLTVKELVGLRPTDTSASKEACVYEEKIKEVFKTGREQELEFEWSDKNAHMLTSHIRIVPEKDHEGAFSTVMATGRDITRLKEQEGRLKEAQKMAKVGSWELGFPGLELFWSEEIYAIFEIDPNEYSPSYDYFLNAIHPEDKMIVDEAYARSLKDKSDYAITHRLLMPDGRIKYVHETSKTFYDEEGTPLRSIGTVQDVTHQKNIEKKIEHMAHHDALTGLPNRVLAKDRAEQIIAYAKRDEKKVALLFIDIDGFKLVNDSLGHSAGDTMLQSVATRLKECVREGDLISRQGGDEFLIVLSNIDHEDEIIAIAEEIVLVLERPFLIKGHSITSSASIGIALHTHESTFEQLLINADTAMYKAKEEGKNRYAFYTQQMTQRLVGDFRLHNDLKRGLQNSEFILHYQPQIDIKNDRICGVEALIRWEHPELGLVSPMRFIPLAEANGSIVDIGKWVIHEACKTTARWHKEGMRLTVAVNISAVQFRRGDLEDVIKNALDTSGLDPHYLELELTESIMIHDTENTLQTVKELKALGVQLSIDDFGTGYSSLSYLKRFAVDKLKIDQSFIRDILKDQEDDVIVKTIIQMAKNLNLKSIAEGVEDEAILALLNSYDCDEVQGYHFSKPMPATEFETYYSQFNKMLK